MSVRNTSAATSYGHLDDPTQTRNFERIVTPGVPGENRRTDESDSFLHEELIPALVVLGVLLVFLPDPVTTTLGLVLVALGVGLWVWDLAE